MTQSSSIESAVAAGRLMPAAAANIAAYLAANLPPWARASIGELVEGRSWGELNDRFYRELEFGTGGMRGRTIGAVAAAAETGTPGADGMPEHAAVGSNMLNDMTLARAVIGLFRYTQGYLRGRGDAAAPRLLFRRKLAISLRKERRPATTAMVNSAPRRIGFFFISSLFAEKRGDGLMS